MGCLYLDYHYIKKFVDDINVGIGDIYIGILLSSFPLILVPNSILIFILNYLYYPELIQPLNFTIDNLLADARHELIRDLVTLTIYILTSFVQWVIVLPWLLKKILEFIKKTWFT
jgi:hypothetical protein